METFSVTEAFQFAWGIYKKLFPALTAATAAVYAVFSVACALVVFLVHNTGLLASPDATVFQKAALTVFVLSAVHFFLLVLYVSFVQSFFRGNGIKARNFFPPLKKTLLLAGFTMFMTVFVAVMPFIAAKAKLILSLISYRIALPSALIMFAVALFFIVLAVYVALAFFYAPSLILDGRNFADSLSASAEIMKGQKIAMFCSLFLLAVLNVAGCLTVVGWLFTVPFSILAIVQIYITISKGYPVF